MSIELIPLCTADIVLGEQIFVGAGGAGMRVIAEVDSVTLTGDRMSATLKGHAAADWVTVNGTIGVVDVRLTLETHDGAIIYVAYGGRIDLTNGLGTSPIYVAPTFETGDERYAWLNVVQAVGKGDLQGSNLTYEMYEVR